jgi:hypothetical protein
VPLQSLLLFRPYIHFRDGKSVVSWEIISSLMATAQEMGERQQIWRNLVGLGIRCRDSSSEMMDID